MSGSEINLRRHRGHDAPRAGKILLADRNLLDLPPESRGWHGVQDYAGRT
jgi:hypothetical protein